MQCAFAAVVGSGVAVLPEMEATTLVEADVWRHVSSPIGNTASTGEHYKHVAGDDRTVQGLDISIGSMARTLVCTSPIQ